MNGTKRIKTVNEKGGTKINQTTSQEFNVQTVRGYLTQTLVYNSINKFIKIYEMGTRIITQRAPVIQTITRNTNNNSGCSCCSCLHLSFLKTPPGLFKIAEVVLGSMCQSMMMNFGSGQSQIIGMSFTSLLTTNSASVFTVSLLLFCYILSETSYSLIRSSLFETLFNLSIALSYCSASTYLAVSVNLYLYPVYLVTLGFIAYPAMIAAYMMGFALGFIHAVDAYYCYRHFKGYR